MPRKEASRTSRDAGAFTEFPEIQGGSSTHARSTDLLNLLGRDAGELDGVMEPAAVAHNGRRRQLGIAGAQRHLDNDFGPRLERIRDDGAEPALAQVAAAAVDAALLAGGRIANADSLIEMETGKSPLSGTTFDGFTVGWGQEFQSGGHGDLLGQFPAETCDDELLIESENVKQKNQPQEPGYANIERILFFKVAAQ